MIPYLLLQEGGGRDQLALTPLGFWLQRTSSLVLSGLNPSLHEYDTASPMLRPFPFTAPLVGALGAAHWIPAEEDCDDNCNFVDVNYQL